MTDGSNLQPLSDAELNEQTGTALPDKEVVSILDLNADLDLGLSVAALIDLAVAANANVAAPIDAAVGANILSVGSHATSLADQQTLINQGIQGDATAVSDQSSVIDHPAATTDSTAPAGTTTPTDAGGAAPADASTTTPTGSTTDALDGVTDAVGGVTGTVDGATGGTTDATGATTGVVDGATGTVGGVTDAVGGATGGLSAGDLSSLDGSLLNVDVNLAADADVTAPINGAVAANANVAAPIDAAVSANIGSVDSDAVAVAQQTAIINQTIDGDVSADAAQDSTVTNP